MTNVCGSSGEELYERLANLGVNIDRLKQAKLLTNDLANLVTSLEEITRNYHKLKSSLSTIEN
jgi:hypothetical protein